jgi:hypothetical protein
MNVAKEFRFLRRQQLAEQTYYMGQMGIGGGILRRFSK